MNHFPPPRVYMMCSKYYALRTTDEYRSRYETCIRNNRVENFVYGFNVNKIYDIRVYFFIFFFVFFHFPYENPRLFFPFLNKKLSAVMCISETVVHVRTEKNHIHPYVSYALCQEDESNTYVTFGFLTKINIIFRITIAGRLLNPSTVGGTRNTGQGLGYPPGLFLRESLFIENPGGKSITFVCGTRLK